jgi:hypothetical protein
MGILFLSSILQGLSAGYSSAICSAALHATDQTCRAAHTPPASAVCVAQFIVRLKLAVSAEMSWKVFVRWFGGMPHIMLLHKDQP